MKVTHLFTPSQVHPIATLIDVDLVTAIPQILQQMNKVEVMDILIPICCEAPPIGVLGGLQFSGRLIIWVFLPKLFLQRSE